MQLAFSTNAWTLHERWVTDDGRRLAAKAVQRLSRRKSLDPLGLPKIDGRVDLRGLPFPQPRVTKKGVFGRLPLEFLRGVFQLKGTQLHDIDLSYANLDNVMLVEASIRNCRFERASLRHASLWATDVTDTSFVGADLRRATLGPWHRARGNVYHGVDFSRADFRGAVCSTAIFVDCDFSHARLVKIDFDSSGFTRCRFAGELDEVTFWGRGFATDKPGLNPMEDVDFSKAVLRWVEFRGLDLDRVRFPDDENHVVVANYPCVLSSILAQMDDDDSVTARMMRGSCEMRLKWLGPRQQVGCFQRLDYLEFGVDWDVAAEVIRRAAEECRVHEDVSAVHLQYQNSADSGPLNEDA